MQTFTLRSNVLAVWSMTVLLVKCHSLTDPCGEVGHSCVDTRVSGLGTAEAPADYACEVVGVA